MATKKQKEAINAIEEYVEGVPKFTGDINSPKDVRTYLSRYLKYLYNNTWAIEHGY